MLSLTNWKWAIFILITEFILSVLLNKNAIAILSRKVPRTSVLSLISGVLYWIRFVIIAKLSDWDYLLMIAQIAGDTLGDMFVANREIKKANNKLKLKLKLKILFILSRLLPKSLGDWIERRREIKPKKKISKRRQPFTSA